MKTEPKPVPAKVDDGKTTADAKPVETVVEPFFGRPPDDPGVREGASKPLEKSTFRLF